MKKYIKNYEGLYEIDIEGNIYSIARKGTKGGLIKIIKDEYFEVVLCKNGKCKRFNLHRLISETFIENKFNLPQINHIDGNKFNNNILNLEWCNNSENQLHAYALGLRKKMSGSKNGNSKLKELDVIEIRKVAKEKGKHYGRKELAVKYNVSECTIKEIVNHRKNLWANVY
jgi:hypothetical protein